jgi:hypothetical protein
LVGAEPLHQTLACRSGFTFLPYTLTTKLKRFLGLLPNSRWECLAVQLQTPTPSGPQQLEQVWKLVGSALGRS